MDQARVVRVSSVVVQRRSGGTRGLLSCWILPLLCALCAPVPGAHAAGKDGPDEKAARVERQMTDEERFTLLHGVLAIPYPGLPSIPPGLPSTAGYVPGIPRLQVPALLET